MKPINSEQNSIYRVVLIGDSAVGKTSLINKFVYNKFNPQHNTTVGASFILHTVTVDEERIEMQIWDTAGQEKFRALGPIYYRNADAAIVTFDLTQSVTFRNLGSWIDAFTDEVGSETIIVIVGNKCDLQEKFDITEEAALKWAEQGHFHYFSTSAVDGTGIERMFNFLATELMKKKKKNDDILINQPHTQNERKGESCIC